MSKTNKTTGASKGTKNVKGATSSKPSKPQTEGKGKPSVEALAPIPQLATVGKGKGATIKGITHANGAQFTQERPGVLAQMLAHLCSATESDPITKSELLDKLCEDFPERDRDMMKRTVAMQVPSGFMLEKGITVNVVATLAGKGYYVDANAPRVPKGERRKSDRDE
jgi:hypothetical protein